MKYELLGILLGMFVNEGLYCSGLFDKGIFDG